MVKMQFYFTNSNKTNLLLYVFMTQTSGKRKIEKIYDENGKIFKCWKKGNCTQVCNFDISCKTGVGKEKRKSFKRNLP